MWKAVTGTRQSNSSESPVSQASHSIPQAPVQPTPVTMDPKSMELVNMLAAMMNLSSSNKENIKKGFQGAQ